MLEEESYNIDPEISSSVFGTRNNYNNNEEQNLHKNTSDTSQSPILSSNDDEPIWLSVSEAAKIGGVSPKTIRRAIQSEAVSYKIIKNRYLITLKSVILLLHTNAKLKNKLNSTGIGQYIKEWKK